MQDVLLQHRTGWQAECLCDGHMLLRHSAGAARCCCFILGVACCWGGSSRVRSVSRLSLCACRSLSLSFSVWICVQLSGLGAHAQVDQVPVLCLSSVGAAGHDLFLCASALRGWGLKDGFSRVEVTGF